MKARLVTIAVLGIARTAAAQAAAPTADQVARCSQGLDLASKGDLPRAYLYFERCDPDALGDDLGPRVAKAKADVGHKLDGSKLSALSIVTTPEGLVAETDAMPGERFTTPATIWTKAGDYKVNVADDGATLDAGKGITTLATLEPFSRRTVIINAPHKKPGAPKDGKVDFNDEEPEAAHVGPPPAVKHGTLLPKKYIHPEAASGPQLDDPFALKDDGSLAWHVGVRLAGGVYTLDSSRGGAVGIAAVATRSLGGPIALATRLGWTHRDVDAIGLDAGVAFRLAGTSTMVLSAGAALHGEVRVQDTLAMEPVTRVGVGAAASLDLALLSVPLVIGLRVEPSFTELVPGARSHAALLEVGYDWR